jgi:hypothetical protein
LSDLFDFEHEEVQILKNMARAAIQMVVFFI